MNTVIEISKIIAIVWGITFLLKCLLSYTRAFSRKQGYVEKFDEFSDEILNIGCLLFILSIFILAVVSSIE